MRLRADRLIERRSEALERNELWAALPPREQLKALMSRPGLSVKQGNKIVKKMEAAK